MSAKIKTRTGLRTHRHSKPPRGISRHSFEKVYWPYIPLALLISGLIGLGLRSGALTHGLKHPEGQVLAFSTSMEPQKLLADTNLDRRSNHTAGLQPDAKLNAAAQAKANDMAARDYWSHATPEGSPPWVFMSVQGYNYQKAGENLAAGFDSEQSTVNAWMASSSHRHNLLDPAYKDVGFGVANSPNYTAVGGGPMTIVVALYGDPAGTVDVPLSIQPSDDSTAYSSLSASTSKSSKSQKTSRVSIALASFHVYNLATLGILVILVSAIGLWVSRHLLLIHRVLVKGERLVFNHPLLDVGLLVTAALAFLLSQTAGLIK